MFTKCYVLSVLRVRLVGVCCDVVVVFIISIWISIVLRSRFSYGQFLRVALLVRRKIVIERLLV